MPKTEPIAPSPFSLDFSCPFDILHPGNAPCEGRVVGVCTCEARNTKTPAASHLKHSLGRCKPLLPCQGQTDTLLWRHDVRCSHRRGLWRFSIRRQSLAWFCLCLTLNLTMRSKVLQPLLFLFKIQLFCFFQLDKFGVVELPTVFWFAVDFI